MGRPALRRATPVWLGVGLIGSIILGGTGLAPRDLVAIGAAAPRVMIGLAIAWLVLCAPAMGGAIGAPGVGLLRSLPRAPLCEALAIAAIALVVHLPWGVLAVLGAGGRGALSWLAIAAVSLGAALAIARRSWRPRPPRWRSSVGALIGVHLRAVVRRRGGSVTLGLGLALLAGSLGGALARNGELDGGGAAVVVAASLAVAAAIALAAIAAVVVDDRRTLAPWLGAAALARGADRLALAAVLGGGGLGLGAVGGATAVVVGSLAGTTAAIAIGAAAACGLGVGAALAGLADRAAQAQAPAVQIAVAAALVAIVAIAVLGFFGAIGVVAIAVAGLGVAAGGGR